MRLVSLACSIEFALADRDTIKTIELPSQQRLFDPFEGVIGPVGRKMIDNGWQGLFRQVLLEQMPDGLIGEG